MFVIIGLVVLIAAVVVGVSGVLANAGTAHALDHGFAVFGYHVTGSTGTLFLYGIVVGAVAIIGIAVLLAAARRTARRGRNARKSLKESRGETAMVSKDRDVLLEERAAARTGTARTGTARTSQQGQTPDGDRHSGRRGLFGGRPADERTTAGTADR